MQRQVPMEAERATIDPALQECPGAFSAMLGHPCADHRNAVDILLTALREALAEHLRHEETEALPLLRRTMAPEAWAAALRTAPPAAARAPRAAWGETSWYA